MTNEYEEISLIKNPILTIQTLLVIIYEQFLNLVEFIKKHKIFLFAFLLYIALNYIEGSHGKVGLY